MIGWKFAFTRRWAGYLALTILFAAVCSGLGLWQLARRSDALSEMDKVETNYAADPVPLAEALPGLDAFSASQKWLPVVVTGTYLTDDELIVRNRPLNIHPGFEVLTPLLLADGSVFIVNRGWLPTGQTPDAPASVPTAPSGVVTVIARLKAGEPSLAGRSATGDQIATINLDEVSTRLDLPTYTGAYGLMASEDPTPDERPVAVTRPVKDEGPHLSYAFQWFVFALMGFVGLGWAIRQEYRAVNFDDPDERVRAAERARRQAAKPRSDSEIEDELIDGR
ncbi:SURF1 family protein [Cryobacterium sp. TMT2-18-3]|uniref:SURF1 family cytochrome oxidase biogenesis protein n=1 Tax=unclassified Cryobacterium TaxID=2649013 RepID=UPI00106D17AE|nr:MULTISPECIES: SURF1 family protein [unclassified Cryobacterium]TFC27835.1 SURF1 family protein [Cryobacterium sp. TMT2-18-2]TFC36507.1 SURF1 family protein [Cryobacterium sp. TMT2-42-4]TFC63156.1 SURF1 family protein [Cryobacterium sp. TMT2-18-3]TFC64660.1 SURF1 family protein [Cryobacterium sp. TMT2-15-1]